MGSSPIDPPFYPISSNGYPSERRRGTTRVEGGRGVEDLGDRQTSRSRRRVLGEGPDLPLQNLLWTLLIVPLFDPCLLGSFPVHPPSLFLGQGARDVTVPESSNHPPPLFVSYVPLPVPRPSYLSPPRALRVHSYPFPPPPLHLRLRRVRRFSDLPTVRDFFLRLRADVPLNLPGSPTFSYIHPPTVRGRGRGLTDGSGPEGGVGVSVVTSVTPPSTT